MLPLLLLPSLGAPREQELAFFRDQVLSRPPGSSLNVDGRHSSKIGHALSMAGQRRIDNAAAAAASVVEDGVTGDFMETGVFRGGVSFVAARVFELLGSPRTVYLADSFSGLPNLNVYTPAAKGTWRFHAIDRQESSAHRIALLNDNSLASVKNSALKLGLQMEKLHFVPGYFNESLPKLLAEEPNLQLSVLRLDGDAFASTLEAIELLYPRLSPGGYLIIDDFSDWKSCREAIDLYRSRHGIVEPITIIPHRPGEIARGAYWRKQPTASQSLCIGRATGSLRVDDGYYPTRLVPLTNSSVIPSVVHGFMTHLAGISRNDLFVCIPEDDPSN